MQQNKQALLNKLLEMVSDHKKELFNQIIDKRSRHLTVVMEDIFQSQNASAVLRSADCFGIQDVHIIENKNEYTLNPQVALGSSKWLNLFKYNDSENNTKAAYEHLRAQGYQIVATTPHLNDVNLDSLDIQQKTALVFGTEMQGLSDYAIENADIHLKIPMYGFTESFNISVSAALCLHHLSERMRKSTIQWQLSANDRQEVLLQWAKAVVKSSEEVERFFG
ncbi:MAG: rRNA methyltransferase [Bacteroidetes bacterium 4572_77]|nr:MAG: rRNA methyltransferase [Bacteroidetes bacterium 4572_77]